MAKYREYKVTYVNHRPDGRVEKKGTETLVLARSELDELSYTAIIEVGHTFKGNTIFLFEGRHCEFDPHLGWVS